MSPGPRGTGGGPRLSAPLCVIHRSAAGDTRCSFPSLFQIGGPQPPKSTRLAFEVDVI